MNENAFEDAVCKSSGMAVCSDPYVLMMPSLD